MFQICIFYADGSGEMILDISRATDTTLNWVFRTAGGDNTLNLSEFGIYDNLRNLFNLLYWNSNAYSHFEFRTPGFPVINVNMPDVFTALPYIEYTMFSLLRNTQVVLQNTIEETDETESVPAPCATCEDEELDEDEDEDDEDDEDDDDDEDDEDAEDDDDDEDQYVDMPPLVPLTCPSTPKRTYKTECPPAPLRPKDGPCHNTRASKRRRDGTCKAVHLFFN